MDCFLLRVYPLSPPCLHKNGKLSSSVLGSVLIRHESHQSLRASHAVDYRESNEFAWWARSSRRGGGGTGTVGGLAILFASSKGCRSKGAITPGRSNHVIVLKLRVVYLPGLVLPVWFDPDRLTRRSSDRRPPPLGALFLILNWTGFCV